ncbi:TPA: helix-turn-helix domain-containing protein [Salmonella enterica subsp. enterica serovar Kottbus]
MQGDVRFMTEIVNWLEKRLRANPGCREVAGRAGYSLRHLQRRFVQGAGLPLVSYIRARRLTRAAVLLRLSHRPVGSIAEEWGYGSHHTFTRAFTRHFGVSPERYRRMNGWLPEKLMPRLRWQEEEG